MHVVGEKQKQEEKCRLAININFLINIRCHAAKALKQLEVEGYFFTEEKFLPRFIGMSFFIHLSSLTSSSSSIFVCEEMLFVHLTTMMMMMKSLLPTHILTFRSWNKGINYHQDVKVI